MLERLVSWSLGAAVTIAATLGPPVSAQAAPDFSGLYEMAARGKELPGFKPIAPNLDEVVTAHLQPWAKARAELTDSVDDLGAVCLNAGIFRHPSTVGGFMWAQRPGVMLMISDVIDEVGVRRIYMTDKHPPNLAPTWNGHSIGHWEGDTLVVDTVGFNDKSWLMSGMQPHTEELHVVERIRSVANGQGVEIVSTVDDRKALTAPYTFSRYYRKTDREFTEAESHGGSGMCNAEPGEQQMWLEFRKNALDALKDQRAKASEEQATKARAPE